MDRRTILAISLSFITLMIYQTLMDHYYPPAPPVEPAPVETVRKPVDAPPSQTGISVGKGTAGPAVIEQAAPTAPDQPLLPKEGASATFKTGLATGHVSLTGGQLADLQFLQHRTELPPDGQPIHYLNRDPSELFYGESGFLSGTGAGMPTRNTVWRLEGPEHVQGKGSIHMVWDNGAGLLFEKTYAFSPNSYLLTVTDRVSNSSQVPVALYHYAQLLRMEPKLPEGEQALAIADFHGPMGFLDGLRVQHDYDQLREQDQNQDAVRGWSGFSDKYFMAALIPGDTTALKKYYFDFDTPTYRVGSVSSKAILEPKASETYVTRLFVGPKEIRTLEEMGLDLERAIDYGWFHFLAQPLVKLLLFFNDYIANYGVAIILLTIAIKLLFFPLANKSYVSMNAMKKLQPKIEELRKVHGSDKQTLNQEMMRLYQENKVNPLGGCLPIVVQIPVFFALYKVLFLSVEMRHAPFFLWITDLSVKDPYYVLPVLMGASMYYQSKLNPAPADPIQAKVMQFLPVIFTFMFLSFPAGLVLYWLLNNVLSIAQQSYIMKKTG